METVPTSHFTRANNYSQWAVGIETVVDYSLAGVSGAEPRR